MARGSDDIPHSTVRMNRAAALTKHSHNCDENSDLELKRWTSFILLIVYMVGPMIDAIRARALFIVYSKLDNLQKIAKNELKYLSQMNH